MQRSSSGVAPEVDLSSAAVRVPEHVVYRNFVKETVALNLESGTYHGLNHVAGRMLETLDRVSSVAAAAVRLADDYGEDVKQVERDLVVFCADLIDRGLIEIDATGSE